jgi:hypothetical protein
VIAHISIGVTDIDRSKRFYDTALEPLGYKCLGAARTLLGYGYGRDSIAFWVFSAERPVPSDEKSGPALLLYSAEHRCRRCVSRGGAALRRAGQRCARPAPRIQPRLLRRLHHRSGRIPDRGVLRPRRNLKSVTIRLTHYPTPAPVIFRASREFGQRAFRAAVPIVRIHLPPAGSHVRTCVDPLCHDLEDAPRSGLPRTGRPKAAPSSECRRSAE